MNYLWADEKFKPLELKENEKSKILKKFSLPEKYILFVSVLEERKNLNMIIKVSDILLLRGIDIKFVLVGREGFGFEKISSEFVKRKNQFIHLKEITSEDLVLIYNLATIFFFPSHYEGFGLPPLEAMKCSIPVVASDNSSLPEVVGEAGFLGDSNDYEFFADSITKLLTDEELYFTMQQKAIEQANKFTAEAHVIKLINIFNHLV